MPLQSERLPGRKPASRDFSPRSHSRARRSSAYALGPLQENPPPYDQPAASGSVVANDPLNKSDPSGKIEISLGIEAEATAVIGVSGGVQISVSIPVPGIDPPAIEFDVGARLYGSARSGFNIGAGGTFGVSPGSSATKDTFTNEVEVSVGPPGGQLTGTAPLTFPGGQPMIGAPEPGGSGNRAREQGEIRSRAGLSTGGASIGATQNVNLSARQSVEGAAKAIGDLFAPKPKQATPPTPRHREPSGVPHMPKRPPGRWH
jgi:hypothetical protein